MHGILHSWAQNGWTMKMLDLTVFFYTFQKSDSGKQGVEVGPPLGRTSTMPASTSGRQAYIVPHKQELYSNQAPAAIALLYICPVDKAYARPSGNVLSLIHI